ncbi:MAG: PQQ-dependent sugar dehydrogenase [Verrucomicrobiota bacterium]
MKILSSSYALPGVMIAALVSFNWSQPLQSAESRATRTGWTNSRVIGSPDPAPPYRERRVHPNLAFHSPVDLSVVPDTRMMVVAEQGGQVFSWNVDQPSAKAELALDLNRTAPGLTALYGVTFHPGFKTNRFVYLCYVLKDGQEDGSRVSRFTLPDSQPLRIEPASEQVMITWLGGGHNGGCLKFGPDGYLYISTGDGAGPNPPDPLHTGQDNHDLLSCILRIDVDHPAAGRPYQVPADNPFLNRTDSRPEIWAYGFRNPWRMSFDRKNGTLWVADVGWELWEMVYAVERGGNYGWSIVEGPQPVHSESKPGPTPILPPRKAHPHSEAASITGGCVYDGSRLPDLVGAYIYGDWVTGKIWALRGDRNSGSVIELVDTPLQIVAFSDDPNQELLILDYRGGLYTLEANTAAPHTPPFPRRLSETGLFDHVATHQLAPGVRPFQIVAPLWADGAVAERFVAFPGRSCIQIGATNIWGSFDPDEWRFPTNAVLGKTLSLPDAIGGGAAPHRIETQILHFDGSEWHGYTYRWNEGRTDASLEEAAGGELVLPVSDARAFHGQRQQTWRFHSRTECLRCHNSWVNYTLAFNPLQLAYSRPHSHHETNESSESVAGGGKSGSRPEANVTELERFTALGYLDRPVTTRPTQALTDPYDAHADLNARARSWLHVNCSHCHREGAGGSVAAHFSHDLPLREMHALDRPPTQGTLGLSNARVIAPGDPSSSVLFFRIATTGQGRMPLIGSSEPDLRGVSLLSDWISQLPGAPALNAQPADDVAQRERDVQAVVDAAAPRPWTTSAQTALDHLLASPNAALALWTRLVRTNWPGGLPDGLLGTISHTAAFQVQDLFDRFLPAEARPQKLGPNPKREQILALSGDAAHGKALFFREAVQCSRCHVIQGQGRDLGPDLSLVGAKYSSRELLEQVLEPSKAIDPRFIQYQVETKDGSSWSGFIVKRERDQLWLKDVNLAQVCLHTNQIVHLQPQSLSAMPEALLQGLTAQDAADLIAFLSGLKP